MAEGGHDGAWYCGNRHQFDEDGLRNFCPPEGCPKGYCARDGGWKAGDPSPLCCQGLAAMTDTSTVEQALEVAAGRLYWASTTSGNGPRSALLLKWSEETRAVIAALAKPAEEQAPIGSKLTAAQICDVIRAFLDADDATHWGDFEKALDRIVNPAVASPCEVCASVRNDNEVYGYCGVCGQDFGTPRAGKMLRYMGATLPSSDTLCDLCQGEGVVTSAGGHEQRCPDCYTETLPASPDALVERLRDAETSLRIYDEGGTSEYWERHSAPLPSPRPVDEVREALEPFRELIAEDAAAEAERTAQGIMPAYHSRSVTAQARLYRAARDILPGILDRQALASLEGVSDGQV